MKKWSTAPRLADAIPPLKDFGPSRPVGMFGKIGTGRIPDWIPQATNAWVMSNTPQARPPQKIARSALEEFVAAAAAVPMSSPSLSCADMIKHGSARGRTRTAKDRQIQMKSCLPSEISARRNEALWGGHPAGGR